MAQSQPQLLSYNVQERVMQTYLLSWTIWSPRECCTDSTNWREQSSIPPNSKFQLLFSAAVDDTIFLPPNPPESSSGNHSKVLLLHKPPHANSRPTVLTPPPTEHPSTSSSVHLHYSMTHFDDWNRFLTVLFRSFLCPSVTLQFSDKMARVTFLKRKSQVFHPLNSRPSLVSLHCSVRPLANP